ncbi:hypothetical protein [Azospirillum sp. sgz302134]
MQTLWNALRRRWLDSGGDAGVEHLCDHLRRDVGLTGSEHGHLAAEHIRERNFSDARSFLTLQAYR